MTCFFLPSSKVYSVIDNENRLSCRDLLLNGSTRSFSLILRASEISFLFTHCMPRLLKDT